MLPTPTTNDAVRSSVFLFRVPDGVSAGDVVKNVYEKHQMAIANLRVPGHDLVRISPTLCNTMALSLSECCRLFPVFVIRPSLPV